MTTGTLPTTMRAVLLTGHGDYDVLDIRDDVARPDPAPGNVLVRVGAAGVNNTDLNTRVGWYSKGDNDADDAGWGGSALELPRIQGADICGEVVALGANVRSDLVGARILVEPCLREFAGQPLSPIWYIGSECDGGFADYVEIPELHAHVVTSELTDIELASFPCSYSTAENMLTRAGLSENDTVLVTGASGGVGSAAVQLAKARGAQVIAVTSASKADAIRQIGADQIILRDQVRDLPKNSVDVVIDLVAGPDWPALLDAMRRFGRYAVSGANACPIVELDVRTLYLKDLSFFGCTELDPEVFPRLVSLIETGAVRPLVAETYPLQDIVKAQKSFAEKQYIGKIVLDVKTT